MRDRSDRFWLLNLARAMALGAVASISCDGGPSAPAPIVTRLQMTGPDSVAPGGAEQFRVMALTSDGVTRDVTPEAVWNSANGAIISLSSDGLATGRDRGETDIRAAFSQMVATKRVMVLPAGTFRLFGKVVDANVGVNDARVEVTAGAGTGLSATTQNGDYALYGVAGQIEIRVTREGYVPRIERPTVTRHQLLNIHLVLLSPPWDPSGKYTMTVAAAPECHGALPEQVWTRRFPTVLSLVAGDPRHASMLLEGEFATANWAFWYGTLTADTLVFDADSYYGPVFVERLAPARFFFVEGGLNSRMKAEVARSAAGLEGFLEAVFSIGEGEVWYNSTRTAGCFSSKHRLELSR